MAAVQLSAETADGLGRYLEHASAQRFDYGAFDCALFVADWVALKRQKDPAATWRGTYSTARGAARVIDSEGGMEGLLAKGLESVGCVRTIAPRKGDVGLVLAETPKGEALACALCVAPGRWAFLAFGGGVEITTARATAAWRA